MRGWNPVWVSVIAFIGLWGGCADDDSRGLSGDGSTVASAIATDLMHNAQIKSFINTGGTGKCMDVAGGYTGAGTPIVQYTCHQPAGANQAFHVTQTTALPFTPPTFQIVSNLDTTMCVGINIPSSRYYAIDNDLLVLKKCLDADGNAVLDTEWIGVNDQQFAATPSTTALQSAAPTQPSALCIDVASGLNWDSLWLQTYKCHGGPNQKWVLTNI